MLNINIEKYNIKKDNKIIIGVSSGPDSMALLHLLEKQTKNIICAHINHGVREESIIEEEYLKNYCKKNNIIFESFKIKKYKENNFEAEARKYRYSFFESLIKKYQTPYLFLAHHADDLIETILMKIIRGSNINGYSGFKEITNITKENVSYKIIRPLINYTKEEILIYNKEHNIKYFIDKTNKENICQRNNIRNNILPILKEYQNVHKNFLKYSNTLEEYNEYVITVTQEKTKLLYQNNYLNTKQFNIENKFIKKNILYNILKKIYKDKIYLITEKHINNIINLSQSSKPNAYINIPLNKRVIKEYNKITIIDYKENKDYKIEFKNYFEYDNHIITKIDKTKENGNNICRLNSKNIKLPLYIRNRQEKDYIYLLGTNGKAKIKDIFINAKIPKEKRHTYPILVDTDGKILWIPNIKKSKFNSKNDENYDIILKYNERKSNINEK